MDRFCALDFETTGLQPRSCDVIEYGAVRFDTEGLGEQLTALCKPRGAIPTDATMVNGITDRMVKGCQPFENHLDALLAFIGDRTVVCHNAPFDMAFLNRYCLQGNKTAPVNVADTLVLARRCFRHLPSHNLKSVAQFLRVPQPKAHRALADALVTAQIYCKLLDFMTTSFS